ncbi:MAG TPA: DUF3592 domain-containing protein [Acidimicrobiales bacterium]|nr:DUF3592 domain-containing protein [Acidimicrobiales bacterium]
MTIAPPRSIDAGDAGDVEQDAPPDTAALDRQAHGLRLAAALFLLPTVVLAALAIAQHRMYAPLLRDGLRAPAEVVGGSIWKFSDRVRVAFATPDGRLVEASIPINELSRHPMGATVEVAYDPGNPRRVRTVEDWNDPYGLQLGMAAGFALLSLGIAWRGWRWPRRLRRVAAYATTPRPMVLASVTVSGRAPTHWAVLWDRDAPPSAHPVLAFRLADADDAPEGAVDVDVFAERRRKAAGYARTPDGVIWPAGKIRPLSRAVRRAVDKAEQDLPDPEDDWLGPAVTPPAGAALPDLRGDLPPLPPELFKKVRRNDGWSPKRLIGLVPLVFVVTGPFVLPEVVESRRQICPKPPPATPGEAGVLPAGALASTLPTTLSGYTTGAERERGIASFANPATAAALVNAGFVGGYERNFVAGALTVKLEVFQFDSDLGPVRYESRRLASQCTFGPDRLPVPAGVSGAILPAERPIHRMTFVRGSRDYIVNMEGFGVSGEAEVLARLLETAR